MLKITAPKDLLLRTSVMLSLPQTQRQGYQHMLPQNLCMHIDFETAGEIEQWFKDAYDWLWNMESCRG